MPLFCVSASISSACLELMTRGSSGLGNTAQGEHKSQNPQLIRYGGKKVSFLPYFAFKPKLLKFWFFVPSRKILALYRSTLFFMFHLIFMCLTSVWWFRRASEHSVSRLGEECHKILFMLRRVLLLLLGKQQMVLLPLQIAQEWVVAVSGPAALGLREWPGTSTALTNWRQFPPEPCAPLPQNF